MGGWIKYLAAAVVAVGACGCTAPFYMQSRQGTAVGSGMPAPQEIDSLTRLRMTVGAEETFSLLLGVLRAEGCFVETADRSSGLVVARQVLPYEGAAVPVAGEIRRMSFLVAPAQQTSEVCLTIYVSRQWYSSSAQAFCTEELGLATDPELYGEWFGRLDRAVPR